MLVDKETSKDIPNYDAEEKNKVLLDDVPCPAGCPDFMVITLSDNFLCPSCQRVFISRDIYS